MSSPSSLPPNALTVVFFDAGQGDCTLIVFPKGTVWMIDCGSTKNSGVVGPEIKKALARLVPSGHIDHLILTHADEDHYNLLGQLLTAGASFGYVTYGCGPSLYKNKKYPVVYEFLEGMFKAGKTWSPGAGYFGGAKKPEKIDGVDVLLLAAGAVGDLENADGEVKNGNSIVLLIYYGGYKIFLMGDATAKTEKFILAGIANVKGVPADLIANVHATTLKMGHHGSDTSSSQPWITAVQPNGLVVSADAKLFGAVGMPKVSQISNVMSWTKVAPMGNHPCVIFDDTGTPMVFKAYPEALAFASTLCDIQYNKLYTEYQSAGMSWYWYVGSDGSLSVNAT